MIAVIDYGAGNLRSVMHALHHLGERDVTLIRSAADTATLRRAQRIILPGVGSFGAALKQLRATGIIAALRAALLGGCPYLGICLGMQFLFEGSEEDPSVPGLGLIGGTVRRFSATPTHPVPHMGWNQLHRSRPSPLLNGVSDESYVYFVHSYYCSPADETDALLTTDYGGPFCSAIQRDHLFAVQFHPEKSQRIGLQILANFLEWRG